MKKIYVKIISNNKFGYDIDKANVYKEYKQYGIAITRYSEDRYYELTDVETGLTCGKAFRKLKDAKSFMEHSEEANFKNWFKIVERARSLPCYESKKIKVR